MEMPFFRRIKNLFWSSVVPIFSHKFVPVYAEAGAQRLFLLFRLETESLTIQFVDRNIHLSVDAFV